MLLTVADACDFPKLTDCLASVLANLLEVLGGSVLVVAAVLGEEGSHLLGRVGADLLDVGGLRALAVRVLVCGRNHGALGVRNVLDGGDEACRRSGNSDARGDREDGEEGGGLCEHAVGVSCGWCVGGEGY